MPYNLFIIPILTGYLILTNSSLFKYNSQRITKNRIILESAAIGLLSISAGFIFRGLIAIQFPTLIPFFLEKLSFIPFVKPLYFWTFNISCLTSLALFTLIELLITKLYSKSNIIIWSVDKNGNELEKLVTESVINGKTIQLTLKNDKVYIGFCEETPIPQKTNYIILSPILSGYREKETKRLQITTNYFKIIEEFIDEIETKEGIQLEEITLNTHIVIKQDEILTASIYEQDIYDKFNKHKNITD